MKVSHALTAIAALAAMDGIARAGPVATPPGRGDSELATTSVEQTSKVAATTSPTDAPSPLGPLGIPFGLPYIVNSTRESGPIGTGKPFLPEHGLPKSPKPADVDDIESAIQAVPTLEVRQLVDGHAAGNESSSTPIDTNAPQSTDGPVQLPYGRVGPQIAPTPVETNAATGSDGPSPLPDVRVGPQIVPTHFNMAHAPRDTDGPFPGPDGRVGPQIVPTPVDMNAAKGTDGPFPGPDGRVGPQIVPTPVNMAHAPQDTDGPFAGPDSRVGPQIVPGEENGKARRQVFGPDDRSVIPMPSGVPEEFEDH